MNKKISLGLALSLIAIAVAVTFILTSFFSLQSFNKKVVDVNDKARRYDSLESLDTFVRDNYFGEIDERDLSDGILKGYVDGLDDKYSRYLTEEEYINEMSEEAGQLVGLGLTLSEDESGYVRIDGILQDSPLYNSGLQEGDILVGIGDQTILGDMTLRLARASFEPGEIKTVYFWRDGQYYSTEMMRPESNVK